MIRWLISAVYVFKIYLMRLVIGLIFAPYAIVSRNGAVASGKSYC